MIAYDIKTATEHRPRWPAAVAKVWNMNAVYDAAMADPNYNHPGARPENIFDFHDGLRLIVSMEQFDWGEHLHVSASVRPDSPLYRDVAKGRIDMVELTHRVINRVHFLGGPTVHFGFLTPGKGVPHYYHPPLPPERIPTDE